MGKLPKQYFLVRSHDKFEALSPLPLGEGFRPAKSHVSLVIWSCDVIWQNKNVISPLPLDL